ncbi:MAG: molybdenum cofactor biosynthesis protein [Chloroflexi bacterium]|nr:molybdenum cofactor biosynthesis protein [Chloroflexota bacterium]
MRPFGALLSYEEAKKVVDANIKPITRVETTGIDDASGRVLAVDVTAAMSIPPFDRAAMDGYAVKATDTFGSSQSNPRILHVVETVHAGETTEKKVGAGECFQIATGAMMPKGADAVVMVEDTEAEGDGVKVFKAVLPNANVGRKGEDIKKDELVLKQGTFLDAGKIGVLASQGIRKVEVYGQPRVAILPTGEEVQELGKKLKKGQLYDINSHTVASVVKANGGIPNRFEVVGDDPEELRAVIGHALENDVVVLSGGSSVGERDLLVKVIEGWGHILFHGLQVRPGKPTLFAMIDGKPLFGMPGYPTSCLTNAYLFLLPAIRKMAHLPPRRGETVEARLARRVSGNIGRRQFLTVKIEGDEAVIVFKESGAITSIANADGYIEIPENIDLLEKGTPVTVTLF